MKVLVTGTTSGIGKQIVNFYHKKNFNIISINRTRAKIKKVRNINNFNIDITNKKKIENFILFLKRNKKVPKIFILNAGINIYDNLNYFDLDNFKKCFNINFYGALNFVGALEKHNIINKRVIFISSTSNIIPNPASFGYYASKLLLKKIVPFLNLNNKNVYKAIILGPILSNISRNLKKQQGIGRVIYNLLAKKPSEFLIFFDQFIFSTKKITYYTKTSMFVYFFIKLILFFFPFLYKGGK